MTSHGAINSNFVLSQPLTFPFLLLFHFDHESLTNRNTVLLIKRTMVGIRIRYFFPLLKGRVVFARYFSAYPINMTKDRSKAAPPAAAPPRRKGRSSGDANLIGVEPEEPFADKKKKARGEEPHRNLNSTFTARQPEKTNKAPASSGASDAAAARILATLSGQEEGRGGRGKKPSRKSRLRRGSGWRKRSALRQGR